MAYDAYIAFTGSGTAIKGESTRKGFENWIEIDSFTFGVDQKVTIGSATQGAGAGKVQFSEFQIRKQPDASSPLLYQACCAGQHWDKADLVLNKAGGNSAVQYLKFEFKTVFLSHVRWHGDTETDDGPTEELSFVYGVLTVTYTPQKVDGTAGSAVVGSWNQIKNERN